MIEPFEVDEKDVNWYVAGFGGAVAAYAASVYSFTGELNLLQLGIFVVTFFPLMLAFDTTVEWAEERDQ